ncbi:hypothetical protein [Pseudomonas sp. DWRC2-2]|uniref:hypothetical protein n=1 Tax=Pseudomonas sp. DWRC2-2 TaxID=2804567 RepID=UPI003CEEC8CA
MKNTLFLLLFGARTADLRSKRTKAERNPSAVYFFPDHDRKFPEQKGLHPVAPLHAQS